MSHDPLKLFSIVIPARDECEGITSTVERLDSVLEQNGVPHEIIVVDDGSTDDTPGVLKELAARLPSLRPVRNNGPNGFGRAVICGLNNVRGDAVAIVMADASDSPEDVVLYWKTLNEGCDCVFGSRFIKGGSVSDYPRAKLFMNRLANLFIKIIFNIGLNDTTNAFKAYRSEVIAGCRPLIAPHFNLTVELPLKAIIRGFTWKVVPISWHNRTTGIAKLKIKEMGSRYLFIVLYLWLEKYFSRGDYVVATDASGKSG
jgi:dolichol-phosphate mannosyltransferase